MPNQQTNLNQQRHLETDPVQKPKFNLGNWKYILIIVLLVAIIDGLSILNKKYEYIVSLWTKIGQWLFDICLSITAIFIIRAIYNFVTAGDNKEKIRRAKKSAIYALIVFVIGILIRGLIKLFEYV